MVGFIKSYIKKLTTFVTYWEKSIGFTQNMGNFMLRGFVIQFYSFIHIIFYLFKFDQSQHYLTIYSPKFFNSIPLLTNLCIKYNEIDCKGVWKQFAIYVHTRYSILEHNLNTITVSPEKINVESLFRSIQTNLPLFVLHLRPIEDLLKAFILGFNRSKVKQLSINRS